MWYVIQVKTGEESGIARKLKIRQSEPRFPLKTVPSGLVGHGQKRNIFCSQDTCSWIWISQPETITG